MGALLEQIAKRRLLVSDGAWGTMLQSAGLAPGECPELWNVLRPERVRAVAAAYAAAGADMVLTNTFGGSAPLLRRHGLEARLEELNAAGVRLSREGAPNSLVAASIGPTGELPEPLGEVSPAGFREIFSRQIAAVLAAGARIVCVETMTAIQEAVAAVAAARQAAAEQGLAIEVIATMTFTAREAPQGGYRTVMGVDCREAAEKLSEAGADVLGSNCGNGIEQMVAVIEEFRRHTAKPLLVHANAGMPELIDGTVVYRQGPQHMASFLPQLVAVGASVVGGCCGTTPEHIRALRRAADVLLSQQQGADGGYFR
jgi:5-methyltetrahydrofolate--homocysteine methyltransferase